jgi:hypothetical protein
MQPVDYKSREINLFHSNVNVPYKFRVLPKDADESLGHMFELKTTNADGSGNRGVYAESLFTYSWGQKLEVGPALGALRDRATASEGGLLTEIADRKSADSKLQSNIDTEVGTRTAQVASLSSQIAVEVADRKTDTFNLNASISSEASARGAADTVHTNAIAQLNLDVSAEVKERKSEVVRLDARILQEIQTRGDSVYNEAQLREAADLALGVRCDGLVTSVAALSTAVGADVKRIDGRIDFITSNTNPSALDSLTEIVNNFNVNGASYASRLTYLEGIIQELLNKSQ